MDQSENDDEPVEKRAAPYLADMRSENKHTRERAFDLLEAIGPDPILDQVLKIHRWDVEGSRRTWQSRKVIRSLAIGVAGYFVISSLSRCNTDPYGSAPAFLFGVVCTVVAGFIFVFLKPSQAVEFRRRPLLRLLCWSDNPKAAGALCDSLRSARADVYRSIRNALERLQPRVKGTPEDGLSHRQLATLRRELNNPAMDTGGRPTHDKLQLAILECIDNLGDVGSISAIERMRIYTYSPLVEDIEELRKRCLEVLYKLRTEARQGENLLRSSEKPIASEELLRQAKSPEANSDELLRAADEAASASPESELLRAHDGS